MTLEQTGGGGNPNDTQGLHIKIGGQNQGSGKAIRVTTTNSSLNSGNAFDAFTVYNGGDVSVHGSLVIGTSGKGIDFSAETGDGPSVTSELLDSYEEGHIGTISMNSGGSNVLDSTNSAKYYIKVGRVVHCYFHLVLNGTLSAGTHALSGMPFTSSNTNPAHRGAGVANAQDASSSFGQDGNYTSITTYENSTDVTLYNPVTYVSEDRINVYFSYVTAS
jgi:hypothetical protein